MNLSLRLMQTTLLVLGVLMARGFVFAQPQISYLIPDIGTTRFGTYVEIIGPAGKNGNFGPDGFYMNNPGASFNVRCARASDTANIKIGPCVVSWDGKLISTTIFVSPYLKPNSDSWRLLNANFRIPIEVILNGSASLTDTFYIVKPFAFGDKRSDISRVFGENSLGIRSRRGAMIVDSMYLAGTSKYTVSLNDCDAETPGNQSYLPFVLLSIGNVTGQSGTEIHVGAIDADGGPGGGGGGGGYANFNTAGNRGTDGGNGYTGGGPGGFNNGSIPFAPASVKRKPGIGSGQELTPSNSNIYGSNSLNGTKGGGSTTQFENAGGGTGHPFGTGGDGCDANSSCTPLGGNGGGSGTRELMRGGGGGFSEDGAGENLQLNNGGKAHGNICLIPLAGGSGGASGNPGRGKTYSSRGGGGGGAIAIHGLRLAAFDVFAKGASSSIEDVAGGSGSGGGVVLGMRNDNSGFGLLGVQVGSSTSSGFLAGGRGRTRFDARLTSPTAYIGPLTDTMTAALRKVTMTGNGNGSDLQILVRGENNGWVMGPLVTGYGGYWRSTFTLPLGDTLYYVAVAQKIPSPIKGSVIHEPDWAFSQSAWNILRLFGPPIIEAPPVVDLGVFRCPGEPLRKTIYIKNSGESPLEIQTPLWTGAGGFRVVSPVVFPDSIKAQDSNAYVIEFVALAGQTGPVSGRLTLNNNDTAKVRNPYVIDVNTDVRMIEVEYSWRGIKGDTIDVGTICLGKPLVDQLTVKNIGVDPVKLTQYVSGDLSTLYVTASLPATIGVTIPRNLLINVLARKLGRVLTPTLLYIEGCVNPDTLWLKYYGVSPQMTLVGSGQFGTVAIGSTRQLAVEIRNDGTSDLDIQSIPAPAAPFRLVSATPAPPSIIAPGKSMILVYEYAPVAAGSHSDVVDVLSVIGGASCADSVDIVLAGMSQTVDIVADPTTLEFLPTRVCELTFDTVFVVNKGSAAVTLKYPAFINGVNSTDFSISIQPLSDTSLQPGGRAMYVLAFRPTGASTSLRTAELAVRTSSTVITQVNVPLQGLRTSVNLTGSRVINLGLIPIGVPSGITEDYTNASATNIDVVSILSSRSPTLVAAPQTFTLLPTEFKSVTVTVTPTAAGSFQDTLRIVTGDPCADTIIILVKYSSESGSAGAPSDVTFGVLSNCESKRDSITYSNNGSVPIDLLDITITGADAGLFTVQNPGAVTNVTLAPGQSSTVFILFDPRTATDGLKTAQCVERIRINNQPTQFVTQLTGTRRTTIPSAPGVVAFGEIDVSAFSDQSISIVNTADVDVRIRSIKLKGTAGGVFTLTNSGLPIVLAPKQRTDIAVRFTPTDRQYYYDTIEVGFDLPCQDTRLIPVSGKGRLNVEILVIMPKLYMDPANDAGEIPITAKIVTGTADRVTTSLRMIFTYESSTFVVQKISKGTIIRNSVFGGMTEVEIDVPDIEIGLVDTNVVTLTGQATIGPVDSTVLDITFASMTSNTVTPTVRQDDGWLVLGICEAGGKRLVQKIGSLSVKAQPNPASDILEIVSEVFERGLHSVQLTSITGQTIATDNWMHEPGGSIHTLVLNTKDIPAGVYQLRLTTPTRTRFVPVSVIH
ncbi:MAG: choice-of-anchor D domain-containing protein [Ignavibacteria bacterium]|nr:choice-of-anchor D domain-containing protein [Ignavibacteria bacterium]